MPILAKDSEVRSQARKVRSIGHVSGFDPHHSLTILN